MLGFILMFCNTLKFARLELYLSSMSAIPHAVCKNFLNNLTGKADPVKRLEQCLKIGM